MSTYKAISGVSSTVRALLLDRMTDKVDITIAPPDVTVNNITGRRLNMYLYQVAENPYLKNQEIPGIGSKSAYGHPPLSLDLHYLFTSFGSSETAADADLEAQQILGDAMRVLHDFAIVGADLVQKVVGTPPILDPSLIDEFEQVKLTLEPKSVDEISKIWTALPRVNFRRSVAYCVSVVQIQNQQARAEALPVQQRNIFAFPLASPFIQQVFRQPPLGLVPVPAVEEGETLRITGDHLRAPGTRVLIDQTDVSVAAIQNQRIDVTVPANQFKIGLHTVDVVQDLLLPVVEGQPPEIHPGFHSNAVGLMLLPHLVKVQPPLSASTADTVTVTVSPKVLATQQKFLLLGNIVVPAAPVKFDSPPSATIDFPLAAGSGLVVPPGTYFLRVRVDGAETRLTTNPVTSRYDGPTYKIV
jgi:hypothetical protein